MSKVTGGIVEIVIDGSRIFKAKWLTFISAAKGTTVMRASHGHLQDNTVRLAGRPNDGTLIIHSGRDAQSTLSIPCLAGNGQTKEKLDLH